MKRTDWPVGDYGIRPVSEKQQVCAYCRQPRGEQHKPECVIRQRTVVLRLTLEFVTPVPESFEPSMIEFQRNEGTRCADMTIEYLYELLSDERCFCGAAHREEFLRDATARDEVRAGVFVEKCES